METRPGNGHEIRDHEHTDIPVRTIGKYMLGLAIQRCGYRDCSRFHVELVCTRHTRRSASARLAGTS